MTSNKLIIFHFQLFLTTMTNL